VKTSFWYIDLSQIDISHILIHFFPFWVSILFVNSYLHIKKQKYHNWWSFFWFMFLSLQMKDRISYLYKTSQNFNNCKINCWDLRAGITLWDDVFVTVIDMHLWLHPLFPLSVDRFIATNFIYWLGVTCPILFPETLLVGCNPFTNILRKYAIIHCHCYCNTTLAQQSVLLWVTSE